VNEVRARGYAFSRNTISQGIGIIGAALPKGPFGDVRRRRGGPRADLEENRDEIVAELEALIARLDHS